MVLQYIPVWEVQNNQLIRVHPYHQCLIMYNKNEEVSQDYVDDLLCIIINPDVITLPTVDYTCNVGVSECWCSASDAQRTKSHSKTQTTDSKTYDSNKTDMDVEKSNGLTDISRKRVFEDRSCSHSRKKIPAQT